MGRVGDSAKLLLLSIAAVAALGACSQSIGGVGGIQLEPDGTSLGVSWNPVPQASGYLVYVGTSTSVSSTSYTAFANSTNSSVTIKNLTVGSNYYCVVYAYGMGGLVIGPSSDIVSAYLSGAAAGAAQNSLPAIQALSAYPGQTAGQVLLAVSASDPDGDTLTYGWSVDGTALATTSPQVIWQGGAGTGAHSATVTVSDGIASVSQSVGFTL